MFTCTRQTTVDQVPGEIRSLDGYERHTIWGFQSAPNRLTAMARQQVSLCPPRRQRKTPIHQAMIMQQYDIGFENLLLVYVSKQWKAFVQSRFDTIGSMKSSSRWATNLILQLWDLLSHRQTHHEYDRKG
mmetsp:Transcript_39169/g.58201  ORF Transcript_39169/g.58201 Transcript_39169/m.58201 type:complete len:130 (+) Transcript_39169:615-1004(+)